MLLQGAGEQAVAETLGLLEPPAAGIDEGPHGRDEAGQTLVSQLKQMTAVFDRLPHRGPGLRRQADHEKDIDARAAQAERFLEQRFHRLCGIAGLAFLGIAHRLFVAFGAELHAPVTDRAVDVLQEGSRRQRKELEHDFIGEIRLAQPLQHLRCVLGAGHEQIADQYDGRMRKAAEGAHVGHQTRGAAKDRLLPLHQVGATGVRGAAGDALEGAALDREHGRDGIAPPSVEGQRALQVAVAQHHLDHEIGP